MKTATAMLNVQVDKETSKVLNAATKVCARVPGVSELIYRRVFCVARKPFTVTRTDKGTHVTLAPYTELVLRDVLDHCRSTGSQKVKLEKVKQSLKLGGY